MNSTALVAIDSITIKQDAEGRYCLNDLHKASGGKSKDQPAHFFKLDTTKELINELGASRDSVTPPLESQQAPVVRINDGFNNGTYVVKELVYAYAMWISAAFQLKVIRAFATLQTKGVAVAEHAAACCIAQMGSLVMRTMLHDQLAISAHRRR